MTARRHVATAALFAALAVVHTWPLASAPSRWSRVDNADYSLNAWILAWVVHQAPRDPLHLFDANIFHPEPRTLAFSEHLVPQAIVAAPVRWAGGSAVLACNIVILTGFVFTGWAMAAVMTRWTRDWPAGLLAGTLLAFNGHTLTRLAHVQALHTEYLPLALLALDQILTGASWSAAARFGLFSAAHALTSGYALAFTIAANAAAVLARAREWLPLSFSRAAFGPVSKLAAAAVLAGAIVAPFLVPYWLAREQQGLVRSVSEAIHFSSTGVDYAATAGRFYMQTPLRWGYEHRNRRDVLFPGFVAALLVVVSVATGGAWRDRRARMCLAIGLAGLFLSFGPRTPVYAWLFAHVPLLQGIRAPVRFGFLVLVAVAALAGFGLATGRAALGASLGRRGLALATVTIIVLANLETLRAPLWWAEYTGTSRVYRMVAHLPDAVIAEFPFYPPPVVFRNARYLLSSTVHWKPMLNGYSGFTPASYRRMSEAMRSFPSPPTTDLLRAAGATHVIVHGDLLGARRDEFLRSIEASGEFQRIASDGPVGLYYLLPK